MRNCEWKDLNEETGVALVPRGHPAVPVEMGKHRITLLYFVISAITIGVAAFTLNQYAARNAEQNLVDLAHDQSARDAVLIAEVINQLLDPGEDDRLSVSPAELLGLLRIVDIRLFDASGAVIWSSANPAELSTDPHDGLLGAVIGGEIKSGLVTGVPVMVDGEDRVMDLVESYLPLLPADGGNAVGVVAVYRNVTGTLDSQIAEARNALLKTVLLTLSAVFMVLLAFVWLANRYVFHVNERRIAAEQALKERISEEKDELERVTVLKNRFLSSITHELMTPLTPVASLTDSLIKNRAGNLTETDIGRLQTVRRNVTRLHTMLKDMLQLSLLDSGEYQLRYSEVNLRDLVLEATDTFSQVMESNSQTLELEIDEADGVVEVDEQRITQVVTNLLGNALKYSEPGAMVRVEAIVDDLGARVTITDTGMGISKEDQAELFTKFYRADNRTTKEISGTGIGLVTCKQIVDSHGGGIELESHEGRGTRVTFRVPSRPSDAAEKADSDAA